VVGGGRGWRDVSVIYIYSIMREN
jgi:hypothetical protein